MELTGYQLIAAVQTELTNPLPATIDTYRRMRKDPTIALARALAMAPVQVGEWSIEADDSIDDEQVKFILTQAKRWRQTYIDHAMMGSIDFGWAPFEIVYEVIEGAFVILKLKPLLHDITKILVDEKTGEFIGFKQGDLVLPREVCLLTSFRVEGTQWYGQSLMENARVTYNQWVEANVGAARYDKKVSGSNFIVYYPYGKSRVGSKEIDNIELAKTVLAALESSSGIAMPAALGQFVDKVAQQRQPDWKVELLSDGVPKQYSFISRLQYLDTLKVRALIIPERAITEGKFGTKAEAGVHQDIALTYMDLQHRYLTDIFNRDVVNTLTMQNFGMVDTIRLVAAPIVNAQIAFLQQIYASIISSQTLSAEEFGTIDTDAVKDQLGIPKSAQVTGVPLPGMNPDETDTI